MSKLWLGQPTDSHRMYEMRPSSPHEQCCYSHTPTFASRSGNARERPRHDGLPPRTGAYHATTTAHCGRWRTGQLPHLRLSRHGQRHHLPGLWRTADSAQTGPNCATVQTEVTACGPCGTTNSALPTLGRSCHGATGPNCAALQTEATACDPCGTTYSALPTLRRGSHGTAET